MYFTEIFPPPILNKPSHQDSSQYSDYSQVTATECLSVRNEPFTIATAFASMKPKASGQANKSHKHNPLKVNKEGKIASKRSKRDHKVLDVTFPY